MLECKLKDVDATALIASLMNTWWKCSHSSDKCDFSWSTSWTWLRNTLLQLTQNVAWLRNFAMNCYALYPFSCLSTLIKTRQYVENTIFIVYAKLTV